MLNFVTHDFDGLPVSQASEDTKIGKVFVPKGYVNLTLMCKAGGKRFRNWTRLDSTQEFLSKLDSTLQLTGSSEMRTSELSTDSCKTPLIVSTSGGNNPELQGSFGHVQVALELARWISPEFAVLANNILLQVISGEYQALTVKAVETQSAIRERVKDWDVVRAEGIETRRTLTDAIKSWYERNPGGTTRPMHAMISFCTNTIYKSLWGLDAKGIEEFLGCKRHQARNYMSADCLTILDRAEDRVIDFIDSDNIKPSEAIGVANIRKSRVDLAARM